MCDVCMCLIQWKQPINESTVGTICWLIAPWRSIAKLDVRKEIVENSLTLWSCLWTRNFLASDQRRKPEMMLWASNLVFRFHHLWDMTCSYSWLILFVLETSMVNLSSTFLKYLKYPKWHGRTKLFEYQYQICEYTQSLSLQTTILTKKLFYKSPVKNYLNCLYDCFSRNAAFAGCKFQGTTLPMSSFICPDILPGGIFFPEKCRTNDWCKCVKVEDMNDYNAVSATSISKGNLHPKSFFPQYDFQKVVPPFHGNEVNAATESIFSATSARYPQDLGGPKSVSSPLFRDISLGSEEFSIFDTPSTIQGLSRISESGYAHPLLSSKSQNSPSPLSGIPVARPLVIGGSGGAHYNISQVSEKLIGVSSQASTSQASNKFSLSGNNSFEGSNLGSILMSDSSAAANFDVSNRFYRGSDFMSSKDRLSCEDGATIDLLQLSSQLQRVEHQNQFMQVKDENDSFCCLRIT